MKDLPLICRPNSTPAKGQCNPETTSQIHVRVYVMVVDSGHL